MVICNLRFPGACHTEERGRLVMGVWTRRTDSASDFVRALYKKITTEQRIRRHEVQELSLNLHATSDHLRVVRVILLRRYHAFFCSIYEGTQLDVCKYLRPGKFIQLITERLLYPRRALGRSYWVLQH